MSLSASCSKHGASQSALANSYFSSLKTKSMFQRQIKKLQDVVNAPGNVLNAACNGISSVVSDAGDFFSDTGKKVGKFFSSVFGRRRKREGCGIPSISPDINVNIKPTDLSAIKDLAKKLNLDLDVLDLTLEDFKGIFESQSISSIRAELIGVIKYIFDNIHLVFFYAKKVFYFTSLVLLLFDGYRYVLSLYVLYTDKNYLILTYKVSSVKLNPGFLIASQTCKPLHH